MAVMAGGRPVQLLCIVSAVVLLASCNFDSIYPTMGASWPCTGGGLNARFCQTDNRTVTAYAQSSIIDTSGINSVLRNELSPTVLDAAWGDPVYEGDYETDIIYQQGVLDDGTIGQTWCNDAVGTTVRCDQHYVRFRFSSPWTALACHETGHAVGLTHGSAAGPPVPDSEPLIGCMRTPLTTDVHLGSHNMGQINATY